MVKTTIRLPDDLHKRLKKISEKEKRSFNNLVIYILDIGGKRIYGSQKFNKKVYKAKIPRSYTFV